ncbi:MAG: 30S ribosomal protein S16 [Candidatus Liptonbacteria bacterium CG11_big_fil_rev_8_21_14_0_20_35_14]|uniref:Small ribosomal subunit protein bS16 n=1 Tax=Candidatus Liptonbacteria bacterium CG11_big_fil_rev_8_21_14_0_20_35_14 TaxID=1974634 RepID=A0A2H0N9C9_9BACT|nr:MAG: 30S ribosomal protein S16 [Candidatus Liptonbacteria bacterium CG11_big_fil_rev_8_21_14_0_20_35_14]
MLAIKLKRIGKKKQPSYRIVVAEKKSKANGGFVEDLGFFNPHSKEKKIEGERVNYWIKNGAKPTETVHNLLVSESVILNAKVKSHSTRRRKKHIEKEEKAKAEAVLQAQKEVEVEVKVEEEEKKEE